jgi:autotransporter-associated beta strand protein
MKRQLLSKTFLKQTILAVPAAALMLGAAQAGTVGFNVQSWYYDSGTIPQTVGFGAGYQTTGFPVTGRAFGVAASNWFNADPVQANWWPAPVNLVATFGGTETTFAGGLTAQMTAGGAWESNYGPLRPGFVEGITVAPGNDEVTWSYLYGDLSDRAGDADVTVSGLAAKFPNGYVISAIGIGSVANATFTDDVTTTTGAYSLYTAGNTNGSGLVGISDSSGVFTSDTIHVKSATLAGFIITDKPVVCGCVPAATRVTVGSPFTLTGKAMGLGTLSYQWKHNGTNIPGATSATYTVEHAAAAADNGNYQLVVTSSSYPSDPVAGDVVSVSVTSQMTFETYTAAGESDTSWVMTNADFSVNFGGDDTEFGGVTFTGTSSHHPETYATNATYNVAHSNPGVAWANVEHIFHGSGTPLLTDGTWTGGYGQIDVKGLTVGHVYKAKFIVADTRASGRQINIQAVGAAGASGFIQYAYTDGRYAVITAIFLAKATTASLYPQVSGNAGTQINGFQIKDIFTAPYVPPLVWDNATHNGIWSTTAANWSGSAWPSGSTESSASFGATGAGPVTLGEAITVQDITFSAPGYSISGNTLTLNGSTVTTAENVTISSTLAASSVWSKVGNGQLTLNGVNNTSGGLAIAAGTVRIGSGGTTGSLGSGNVVNSGTVLFDRSDDFTYSGPMSGTGSLAKNGNNTLTLDGAISYSGNTLVNAGTLEVLSRVSDCPYTITNHATLKIGYSTGGGAANTGLRIYGDGTSATTGFYLKGGANYNCAYDQIQLLGAPTAIRQYGTGLAGIGTFDINYSGLWCTAAASGSVIDANVQMISRGYGMSAQIDAGTNTAAGDLVINGPLNVGSMGFYKRGGGSMRLNAAALAGNVALPIAAGRVICGAVDCIGANAKLTVSSGATLDLNGFSQTVTNVTLAGSLKMTINKGGTPSSTVLTVTDGNLLTYAGSLTVTNIGGALTLGDTFTLFNAVGGYSGSFATLALPAANGLAWQDDLAVDGTIKVVTGSVPPTIVTDLCGVTNYASTGGSVSFTITATGDPILRYQWKKNGTTAVGTDSPTLSLSSLTVGDNGYYSVTVTNHFGTGQSLSNYLIVSAPDLLTAQIMADVPWAFWLLDEDCPSVIAYDSAGGQKNGANIGSYTLGVDGPRPPGYKGFSTNKTAYLFDGASAGVNCGTKPAISGTNDFTLGAWINTLSASTGYLIQQRSDYDGEYMFSVNPNGTLHFTIYGGGYQFDFSTPSAGKLVNDGNWHQVAAVRSGTNGYIYIDGSLAAQASGPVRPLNPTYTVGLGKDFRDNGSYFNGAMCDVAIYNYALTPARIADHATTGILGGPLVLNQAGDQLTWQLGALESSPTLAPTPNWQTVTEATSPYTVTPTNSSAFYRLRL